MAVESANTVGYTTASVAKNTYYMLGLQYENVGGGAISVQDLVKGTFQGVDYDEQNEFVQTAPQLQIWTPSDYIILFYLNDAWSPGNVYSAGWADEWGVLSEETFPVGYGFWLKPTSAVTASFTSPLSAN